MEIESIILVHQKANLSSYCHANSECYNGNIAVFKAKRFSSCPKCDHDIFVGKPIQPPLAAMETDLWTHVDFAEGTPAKKRRLYNQQDDNKTTSGSEESQESTASAASTTILKDDEFVADVRARSKTDVLYAD